MSSYKLVMKTKAELDKESEIDADDAGGEITKRAKKLQGDDAKLSFSAARDRVMEGDPALARAYMLAGNGD
ncbi:MAG TPA: hypothetical protein VJ437_11145 [Acidiferrobacterales bacterium]|nr:hypothetical protein [Acidiferrobacterales bacterium]